MKKLLIALSLFNLTSSASADFFGGGNNGEWKMGPYGPYWEENDWPEWTPMYWMQEMSDSFNNDNNGFNFNQGFNSWNMPFFGNNNYGNGLPLLPYGSYGYPTAPMMPYGAMPMPYYGGGYTTPNAQIPNLPVMPSAPINTAPGPSTQTEATGTAATN